MNKILSTFIIGSIGALFFIWFSLPLPYLFGPMLFVAIFSHIPNLTSSKSKGVAKHARLVIGVTVGSAFTPEVIPLLDKYFYSVLLIIPYIVLVGLAGIFYYKKLLNFDEKTAFFSAQPGGLVEMLILADENGADTKKVLLTQSTRLMIVVVSLPFILQIFFNVDISSVSSADILPSFFDINIIDGLLILFCAIFGWKLAEKIKLRAASLTGPMLVSILFYITGLIESKPPFELVNLAQVILGASVGTAFVGLKVIDSIKTITVSFGHFLIIFSITFLFASISGVITDENFIATLMAFAPGGQAEMNVLAILIGTSVPFIAIHHSFRSFLVMAIVPLIYEWYDKFQNNKKGSSS